MRYILTGAQGTGKSSVLHNFEGRMNIITEVVRNLAKNKHIAVNEDGNVHGQRMIFRTYKEALSRQRFRLFLIAVSQMSLHILVII